MDYILSLLKDYDVEYSYKTRILTINKPIEVSLFLYVKKLLKEYPIKDIRVESTRTKRLDFNFV